MLSELVRRELERLCRRALQRQPPSVARKSRTKCDAAAIRYGDVPVRLEEVTDGREVVKPGGMFLLIDRRASEFLQPADEFMSAYSSYIKKRTAAVSDGSPPDDVVRFVESGPRRSVFLDIETTGLCGSPLFLVGLLLYREGELHVRQLFARDYSEEKPLLQHLVELLDEFEVVVTFNGRSFDVPYIRDRCSYNMLPFSLRCEHVDLLHECRRQWKQVLPDCRLQTLESHICYREREDDIPGSEIPRVYHEYVRTTDARLIKNVLHHNALDLITMSDLALRLFIRGD
jgi:uncharacterized protein YprB with RNaseH-like and TPR domain